MIFVIVVPLCSGLNMLLPSCEGVIGSILDASQSQMFHLRESYLVMMNPYSYTVPALHIARLLMNGFLYEFISANTPSGLGR